MSNTEAETTKSKKPSHIAYQVMDGLKKHKWRPIGVAWQHDDGEGFNITLEAIPLYGRFVLRAPTDK